MKKKKRGHSWRLFGLMGCFVGQIQGWCWRDLLQIISLCNTNSPFITPPERAADFYFEFQKPLRPWSIFQHLSRPHWWELDQPPRAFIKVERGMETCALMLCVSACWKAVRWEANLWIRQDFCSITAVLMPGLFGTQTQTTRTCSLPSGTPNQRKPKRQTTHKWQSSAGTQGERLLVHLEPIRHRWDTWGPSGFRQLEEADQRKQLEAD